MHIVANGLLVAGGLGLALRAMAQLLLRLDPADWALAAIGALMAVMVKASSYSRCQHRPHHLTIESFMGEQSMPPGALGP